MGLIRLCLHPGVARRRHPGAQGLVGQVTLQKRFQIVVAVEHALLAVAEEVAHLQVLPLHEEQRTTRGRLVGTHVHLAADGLVDHDAAAGQRFGICLAEEALQDGDAVAVGELGHAGQEACATAVDLMVQVADEEDVEPSWEVGVGVVDFRREPVGRPIGDIFVAQLTQTGHPASIRDDVVAALQHLAQHAEVEVPVPDDSDQRQRTRIGGPGAELWRHPQDDVRPPAVR